MSDSSTVWMFATLVNLGSLVVALVSRSFTAALVAAAIVGAGYLFLSTNLKASDELHWLLGLSVMSGAMASVYGLPGAALGTYLARKFRSRDPDR
jgi:hypothetical protein